MKSKYSNMSILKKMTSYLFMFVGLILIVIFFVQVVLIENIYGSLKLKNVETSAREIEAALITYDNKQTPTTLKNLMVAANAATSSSNNCFVVIDANGEELTKNANYSSNSKCRIDTENEDELIKLTALHEEASQHQTHSASTITKEDVPFQSEDSVDRKTNNMITYAKIVETNENQYTVFVRGELAPMVTTLETVKWVFIVIASSLLFISLVFGALISRAIGVPIMKVHQSAKELAKGNYQTKFDGRGYLEIQELSTTLNYAARELSKVEELRKQLIANMSHDMRTPLTMIRGYAELMRDLPGEATPENLQIIIDETTRLSNLVTDILDMSQIESGHQEISKSMFSMTNLIQETIDRIEKLLEKDQIEIVFDNSQNIFVNADKIKIGQVLYNTILNAITYCGEDKQVVLHQIVDGDHVRIEVEDHGKGIAKEDLPYIWEMYYRSKKNHNRTKAGAGIGLSIVKMILVQHDQKFGVISKEKIGTTVWFELDIAKKETKNNL